MAGTVLGFLGAHALFLGWWTLVPWGLAGLVLGYYKTNRHTTNRSLTIASGMVYGFVLVFVFMIGQYTGDVSLIRRLPFFGLLAIFGAVCGLVLTVVGSFAKRGLRV